jgi:hypothetical protein
MQDPIGLAVANTAQYDRFRLELARQGDRSVAAGADG